MIILLNYCHKTNQNAFAFGRSKDALSKSKFDSSKSAFAKSKNALSKSAFAKRSVQSGIYASRIVVRLNYKINSTYCKYSFKKYQIT